MQSSENSLARHFDRVDTLTAMAETPDQPEARHPDTGLHTPKGGVLGAMERPRRRPKLRVATQAVGALVGVGLAYWAIRLAFGGENEEGLKQLREASPIAIAGLLGLTCAHITLNGLLFWVALRPLKEVPRVGLIRVVLVNTIPTLLAILPFKLGFLLRMGMHHRLDGISIKHVAAWMGAFGALTLAALVPAGGAGLLVSGWVWWALLVVAPALGLGAVYACAKLATRIGLLHRLMLGGEVILTDLGALIGTYCLRLLDIGVQGARFALAASIIGISLGPEQALLLGASYFLIGALAPAGALGVAEMVTALIAGGLALDTEAFALVAIVVSGAHYSGALLMAVPSALIVRPDRLLGAKPGARGSLPSREWA